jgi:hypothetical protein
MADQFVTMIGPQYVVSVCCYPETREVISASFGAPAENFEVTWNLMTIGAGPIATFNNPPLQDTDPGVFQDITLLSPTQFRATVLGSGTPHVQPLRYRLSINSGGQNLVHDPSIVVSPDPVEIPPR